MVGMEVEQSKNPLHSSWQSLLFSPIKNNNPLFNRTSRQDWFVRRMGIGGAFAVSLLVWAFLNDMSLEKFLIRLWVALKTIAFQHWLATHVGDKKNIRAARHPYQSLRFRCGFFRRSTKSAKRRFFATSTFCDHDRRRRFFSKPLKIESEVFLLFWIVEVNSISASPSSKSITLATMQTQIYMLLHLPFSLF